MKFQVSFTVKQKEHLVDAIKVFWKSRNFKDVSNNTTEVLLVRGQRGYKWIAINPLKYYFGIKCSITQTGDSVLITCDAATEDDLVKNTFRDALIKSEFGQFEKYMIAFADNKPFNLKNVGQLRLKSLWPQYLLNFLFPGLGLFFTGSANGYLIGALAVILTLVDNIISYSNGTAENFDPISILSFILFYLIIATIGGVLVVFRNYEKIYEFDND